MMIFCQLRLREINEAGIALDVVINEAQRLELGAGPGRSRLSFTATSRCTDNFHPPAYPTPSPHQLLV